MNGRLIGQMNNRREVSSKPIYGGNHYGKITNLSLNDNHNYDNRLQLQQSPTSAGRMPRTNPRGLGNGETL